jgi:valyl-tRNA synthetase
VIAGTPDFEHRAVGVKPDMKVLGPIFRKEAEKIVKALSGIGEDLFEVPADAVAIEREVVLGGRAVDVLEVDGATVVITR